MSGPVLHAIEGGGDVVSYLEGLTDAARKGEFVAAACVTLDHDGVIGVGRAFRDDVPNQWAMAVAMAAVLQGALMEGDDE